MLNTGSSEEAACKSKYENTLVITAVPWQTGLPGGGSGWDLHSEQQQQRGGEVESEEEHDLYRGEELQSEVARQAAGPGQEVRLSHRPHRPGRLSLFGCK